jgi:hypothetical protein
VRRTFISSILGLFTLTLVAGCGDSAPPTTVPVKAGPTVDAAPSSDAGSGKVGRAGTANKNTLAP